MVKGNNATFNYSTDRARIAELEAENAALREYHAACERFFAQYSPRTWVGEGTYTSVIYARQRLAADHGLPLPGAGEDGR